MKRYKPRKKIDRTMMEDLEDCSDEVDEDLEAMLYSQVHYEHYTVDQETMNTDECSVASTKDTQLVFTVTPVRIDHSIVSSNSTVRSSTASVKQPSSLFETVPFDNESAAELEKSGVDSAFVDIKNVSGIQEDISFQDQTPDIVYLGKSKVDKGGSDTTQHKKPKFDMEAELGICEPSPQTKKGKQDKGNVPVKPDSSLRTKKDHSKAKRDKDIPVKSSAPKFPKTETTVLIPDFIKIVKHSPIKETDYRKTLNRLLTKTSRSKEVKDVVVIKSDNSSISDTTTSSSSCESESEPSSDDKICESSSMSDSESDIYIFDNASADRSAKKSAEPKLDLNWNVNFADCWTIKRIEKASSQNSADCRTIKRIEKASSQNSADCRTIKRIEKASSQNSADCRTIKRIEKASSQNSADCRTIKRIEKASSQEGNSKWKINDADTPSLSRLQRSRYYAKNEIRCRNCDKEGHLSKVCPVPKKKPNCGLCGEEGHLMQRCKHSLCFKCSQPGHRGADCPRPRRDRFARCTRCSMRGHDGDQCPDLWRQYHLTVTSSEDLTPMRKAVNLNIFCCNCAKQGHFAHQCRRDRMDKFNSPTSPFVMKYDSASSKGKKDLSQTKSTDRESKHGSRAKKFIDHHHSNTSEQSHGLQPMYPRGSSSFGHKGEPVNQRYFNAQSSHGLQPMYPRGSLTFGHKGEPVNQRYFNAQSSHGLQPMYPRGSSSFDHKGEPVNQQYFNAQSSTRSMPHHHHTPSSHRFTHKPEKVGQKMHSTVGSSQQHGTPRRPFISPFAKKFLRGFLQEDLGGKTGYNARRSGDQYFDWQGEQSSHHPRGQSRKRQSPSTWDNDGPTPPSKKRKGQKNNEWHTSQHDKGWAKMNNERHTSQHDKGWATDGGKQDKQQQKRKTWDEQNRRDKGWAKKNKEQHTYQHNKDKRRRRKRNRTSSSRR